MKKKHLTKSLFNIGMICPKKLYYQVHPEIYQNNKINDSFLIALAKGGFQVDALAKIYYPEGIDLSNFSLNESVQKTQELLKKEKVTIFEPTFIFENLLVRVDILSKIGDNIHLYEVKAKSFDPEEDHFFWEKNNICILTKWEKYLYDIAFQTYVCKKAYPNLTFNPFLTLVNKSAYATVDGLNQRFLIKKIEDKTEIKVKTDTNLKTIGDKILIDVDVSNPVNLIIENKLDLTKKTNIWDKISFESKISELSRGLLLDQKLTPRFDLKCKKCEFRCNALPPLKSGFKECWNQKIDENELENPFSFDVWYFEDNSAMNDGIYLMKDLNEGHFEIKSIKKGLTRQQRQWEQVKRVKEGLKTKYIDIPGLLNEINTWVYPYHFIDFETSRVAIPFNKGRRPYEQIAFQFSHHIVTQNGTIEHIDEYINANPGVFPNFDFVRHLKKSLEGDNGSIFRYSTHENTVLCEIIKQLQDSNEPDKDDLIEWIKKIVKYEKVDGQRMMIDLCEIVKSYYYHPLMGGSNSLKCVLPAILQDSEFLREKYLQPIYGTPNGIKSTNYKNCSWIKFDETGAVRDPYELLPKLFEGIDPDSLDTLYEDAELNNGGAAMTAYARMQFTQMSTQEREELRSALLKYCELDTFAMVLLYEYFVNEVIK